MSCGCPAILVAVGIGLCLPGCGKPDPDQLAAATIANKELSDAQAVEELAKQVFKNPDAISVEELPSREISLSVTIHPRRDAKVGTLQGGLSAAEVDSGYVLGISVFDGRRMVKYGRQRGLAQLVIKIKHTVLGEAGEKMDVDIFGYTLVKDSFDKYLTIGSAMDIAAGKALTTIEKTCVIDYNHFDQTSYGSHDK
jgi:hypothetical protein